jgi:hypothetical protein
MGLSLLTRRRHLALAKLVKADASKRLADNDDWFTVIVVTRPKSFKPTSSADMPSAKSIPKEVEKFITLQQGRIRCAKMMTAYNARSMKHGWSTWAVTLEDRKLRDLTLVARKFQERLRKLPGCESVYLHAHGHLFKGEKPSMHLSIHSSFDVTSIETLADDLRGAAQEAMASFSAGMRKIESKVGLPVKGKRRKAVSV